MREFKLAACAVRRNTSGCALALAITVLAAAVVGCGGGGGGPSELELKGLRLGMTVEDAARAMMKHGYTFGGKADPGHNNWAKDEYEAAAKGYVAEHIRRVCEAKDFDSMMGYLRHAAGDDGIQAEKFLKEAASRIDQDESVNFRMNEAAVHAKKVMAHAKKVMAESGFKQFSEYLRAIMPSEVYDRRERYILGYYDGQILTDDDLENAVEMWLKGGQMDTGFALPPKYEQPSDILVYFEYIEEHQPDGILSLDNLDVFLERWGDPNELLVPESEAFPDLDAYIAEHYPDGRPYELGGPWDGKSELALESGETLRGLGWAFSCDDARRVTQIRLETSAVNKLFNAGDMTGEEFAQVFVDAYGIVEMAFYANDVDPIVAQFTRSFFTTGWAYVDRENGWAVTISENKQLTVKKVTAAADTKFD